MAEILAPCGSPEVLRAALRAGCDAVYLGGENFSARQNAVNFSDKEIEQAVYECHKRGVKLYRTINTVMFDDQLDECIKAVKHSAETGVDGLITQDLALVGIVRRCCPGLPIHASTQMTVHTAMGVEMTKRLGFSRTVLARELPIDIIDELSHMNTETEVFVHGALCMSVSGQCFMSAVIGSRSANRGLCAQACRLPCSAAGRKDSHDLSLKDLSYYDSIDELIRTGVTSLKIEGRMKRPEYAAMAVDCCKKAMSGQPYDKQTLSDVFSRGGFTDGYLYRKTGAEMFGFRSKEDAEASSKAFPIIHGLYRNEDKRARISFDIRMHADEPITLTAYDTEGNSAKATGSIPQTAKTKAADLDSAAVQLSKLGDTVYLIKDIDGSIENNLFVSPSELNRMRREVCHKLDDARAEANTHKADFAYHDMLDFQTVTTNPNPSLRTRVRTVGQLRAVDFSRVELCAVPLSIVHEVPETADTARLAVSMPRFTFDEKSVIQRLRAAKVSGINKILAANIAHIKLAEDLGMEIHTDYGFNITNSAALKILKDLGVCDAVVSFELKASQIAALRKPMPAGIFAYGRLPLMLTVNCPIACSLGCKNCTRSITDRTGRKFPVSCFKNEGYVEILNSDVLYLADKLGKFSGIDFYMLDFSDESPGEVKKIISEYSGSPVSRQGITRGLYFRGVI